MIYFDNGATTFPKPPAVTRAMIDVMNRAGANPGRSGHKMSLRAGEIIYNCRGNAARLLGVDAPENIIFTLNCTEALNIVIHGLLKRGDHAVISSLEHNAVLRPLEYLKQTSGVSYTAAEAVEGDDDLTIDNFRRAIQKNTRLVICTAASNVFGIRLPVERLAAMCSIYGIPLCVDAAQTAGCVPVSLRDSGISFLCCAGHKGLYGPMGTGLLAVNSEKLPESLIQGGTGSMSASASQPEGLPDKYESGTPNLAGIAGLNEGIKFVLSRGEDRILKSETEKMRFLYDGLSKNKNVILYTERPSPDTHVPVLSFNIRGRDSEEVASVLSDKFNIAVRAGLHCAPLAHRAYLTEETGTVRAVASVFTSSSQIEYFISAVNKFF